MTNSLLGAVKIGVSADPRRRESQLRGAGWELLRSWHFFDGAVPYEMEQNVVRAWRLAGFRPAAPRGSDGWTETVSMSEVDPGALIRTLEAWVQMEGLGAAS